MTTTTSSITAQKVPTTPRNPPQRPHSIGRRKRAALFLILGPPGAGKHSLIEHVFDHYSMVGRPTGTCLPGRYLAVLDSGRHCIQSVSVAQAKQVMAALPDRRIITIYLDCPINVLRTRLRATGGLNEDTIASLLELAARERRFRHDFDYLIDAAKPPEVVHGRIDQVLLAHI